MGYLGRRLRIAPELAFDSEAAVGDMRIGRAGSTEVFRLADIATITREEVEVPPQLIRHNGRSVFTVGVSIVDGRNVVEVGRRVDERMQTIIGELPLGVEVEVIYAQHEVVDEAINEFLVNLMLSVATVVLALCLFMGWRAGAVVGSVLLLTVLGTICVMAFAGIELQRISLGALMIAMGMLVDNAIVVAEGMVIGVRRGMTAAKAAAQSVSRTQHALLGATVIGIIAFGPISLSDDNSGHFLISLFQVVAISLLLSWILAITVVPLFGSYLLKPKADASANADVYGSWMYSPYRELIRFGLRRAWFMTFLLIAITFACIWSFQFVKQGFFPTTNTPLFYVDYRLPEGTDIKSTLADVVELESQIAQLEQVAATTSFVGRGATRFTTIMNPEQPNSAYAQFVVRVYDVTLMDEVMAQVHRHVLAAKPDAEVQVTRAEFTPSGSSKIEARFSGPDAEVLRALANEAMSVYLNHQLIDRKADWRQPVMQLVPVFDASRAQLAGITRADLSQALAFASLGIQVGLYREQDKLIPIIARAPIEERGDIEYLMDRQVWSPAQQQHIPISQVVSSLELRSSDATIYRKDRVRTIRALANPPAGHNATRVFNRLRADIEAIELPPGYRLEWGGEYEGSQEANTTLTSKIPMAFGIMFVITILMFGKLKQPIVIWLTVPMTICGVVIGLLITDLSFTFPSFLGFLSLSGMLIKNCIVLVDEIDKQLLEQGPNFEAVVSASVSRLRPVLLAAGTTIAGMSPCLLTHFLWKWQFAS